MYAAEENLPQIRREIAIQENTLSVLLGHNPARSIEAFKSPISRIHRKFRSGYVGTARTQTGCSAGRAEACCIQCENRVARAQYSPQLALTSLGGAASNQLNYVFTGTCFLLVCVGSITEPIFDGGRIRNNYRLSQQQQKEMLLSYQSTVLNAFKDVSNALVSYKRDS
nr:TolC family protein [Edaphobacter modestus]